MIRGYGADAVRAAEEPLLAAGEPLMAQAAAALERTVREVLLRRSRGVLGPVARCSSPPPGRRPAAVAGARVTVLVGAGNNGGDGLFAAAGLARRGADVTVVLAAGRVHPEGLAAVHAGQARVIDVSAREEQEVRDAVGPLVAGSTVVLDALAGIGVRGALRGVIGQVAEAARDAVAASDGDSRPVVIAVDVPSGIGVDDGALPGVVLPADLTVTMGVAKSGLLLPPAGEAAGELRVVSLGLADRAELGEPTAVRLEVGDVAREWPVPRPSDHKYSRGVLGVLAGSTAYPGAAVLVCEAAAANVGMVRYLGPDGVARAVLAARPEVVAGPGQVQAWVVGSGIGEQDESRAGEVRAVLADALGRLPVVVDAGALTMIPERISPLTVLTPHAGELARLLTARGTTTSREAVEADPVAAVRRAVEVTGATVVLKGAYTLVAGPGTPVYCQHEATPWLATAGAGDVLAGLLGAVLAGRSADVLADPALAARLAAVAVAVHGMAARRASAGGPIVARDVARAVPPTLATLLATHLGGWGRMPG